MSELKDVLISLALLVPSIGIGAVILWRFPATKPPKCRACGTRTELLTGGLCDHCDSTWNRNSPRYSAP